MQCTHTPYQDTTLIPVSKLLQLELTLAMQLITLCNLYISGTYSFNHNVINNLVEQLLNKYILLGDLNSHITNWRQKYR